MVEVLQPWMTPDPDCRWCKGAGTAPVAASVKLCLECVAPFEGWVWDERRRNLHGTAIYFDIDGNEIECSSVYKVGEGRIPEGAVSVGRLCSSFVRIGRVATLDLMQNAKKGRPDRGGPVREP